MSLMLFTDQIVFPEIMEPRGFTAFIFLIWDIIWFIIGIMFCLIVMSARTSKGEMKEKKSIPTGKPPARA